MGINYLDYKLFNRNNMTIKKFLFINIIILFLCSCAEEGRFDINSDDRVPPGAPVVSSSEPYNGSAVIYYTPPTDIDVISVDAQYTRASDGRVFRFSTSYFANYIVVPGLADTIVYDVEVYAVDRAGNHSPKITVPVKPLPSAILKVKQEMIIKAGFNAVFAKWTNELQTNVNVLIDYSFTDADGTARTLTRVFTSSSKDNRYYITDIDIPTDSPVKVKYRVSDDYGNYTDYVDTIGNLYVMKDVEVPKLKPDRSLYWALPESKTLPLAEEGNTIRQVDGNFADGKLGKVIDGVIDMNENLNYMMTSAGHPWSLMIDLRDTFELSRILTHQRQTSGGREFTEVDRGGYYRDGNVAQYRMYRWDHDLKQWELISFHRIETPQGTLSELEWNKAGRAGDMAYMYPDDPKFTKPTRWFRFEVIARFDNDGYYASDSGGSLSEITLYCKEKSSYYNNEF
jgi:hypothetical protein